MAQECPTPATATATVTFKRHNTAPALDGVFTIDAGGSTVKFSRGNLQYKASTDSWQFAVHQYDTIGAYNVNIASDYTGWIDLFGWATSGNPASGTHYEPWATSTDDHYGNASQPGGGAEWDSNKSDWGKHMGIGWRTLTAAEWEYLIETRATGITIAGVNDARWAHAKILTDGSVGTDGVDYNICGLIIFPDGYNQATPTGVTWDASSINTFVWNFVPACTCTTEGWEELEDAGCVFLPCAGYRSGTTVSDVGAHGYYWSSTANISTTADALKLPDWDLVYNYARHMGYSVRLVQVVENCRTC